MLGGDDTTFFPNRFSFSQNRCSEISSHTLGNLIKFSRGLHSCRNLARPSKRRKSVRSPSINTPRTFRHAIRPRFISAVPQLRGRSSFSWRGKDRRPCGTILATMIHDTRRGERRQRPSGTIASRLANSGQPRAGFFSAFYFLKLGLAPHAPTLTHPSFL